METAREYIESQVQSNGMQIGMLNIMSANAVVEKVKQTPVPNDLYNGLWHEGEVACLFADSNLGKSILAVQMAEEISRNRRVLYVDCELSDKQFQMRYYSEERDVTHKFPDSLYRATIAPGGTVAGSYEDAIISHIEKAANTLDAKIIIVDNLTYLCNTSEKGDAAGIFMMKLMTLKMKYGWSLLIIAHTPKRDTRAAITPNDLAGSKKLFNFFDTIFAIGKCRYDENFRYILQVKVRAGEFQYPEDNVVVCEITKDEDGFLKFAQRGFGAESDQLQDADNAELITNICMLRSQGLNVRDIATALGISKSKVGRLSQRCGASSCQASAMDE